MTGRDYAAEMRAVIDAETGTGPFIAAVVAAHIVAKLRATDPELLAGYLDVCAESLIREAITHIDRSSRASARASSGGRRFAEAAGDEETLTSWLALRYVIDDEDTRKSLGQMNRADLTFVADTYDVRAKENAMEAAFMRALAKKVGRGVVADHFSDEQIAAMRSSIVGK